MALKGMEVSIVIIVSAVVILITALIVISVFSGGLGTFNSIFNPWAQQTGTTAKCQAQCSTLCATVPQGTVTPIGYPAECSSVPCICGTSGIGGITQSCTAAGFSCVTSGGCISPRTARTNPGCSGTTPICCG